MKLVLLPFCTLLSVLFYSSAIAQTPCIDGMAGDFPCNNVDLLSFMPSEEIGGTGSNDVWGWVDPFRNRVCYSRQKIRNIIY